MQAASPSVPQASSRSVTPSDSANLAQAVAALDSFRSDSGDTGVDRQRESGTSGGRSSDERRLEEAGQSEQTPGPSQSKVNTSSMKSRSAIAR